MTTWFGGTFCVPSAERVKPSTMTIRVNAVPIIRIAGTKLIAPSKSAIVSGEPLPLLAFLMAWAIGSFAAAEFAVFGSPATPPAACAAAWMAFAASFATELTLLAVAAEFSPLSASAWATPAVALLAVASGAAALVPPVVPDVVPVPPVVGFDVPVPGFVLLLVGAGLLVVPPPGVGALVVDETGAGSLLDGAGSL